MLITPGPFLQPKLKNIYIFGKEEFILILPIKFEIIEFFIK